MKQMQFTIVLTPDDEELGVYAVSVKELPGCYTQGSSVFECLSRAAEAIAGFVESEVR
jgi:predicted RNase H-like HicB family nuclease